MPEIKPENLNIVILSAEKRSEEDNYERGQCFDGCRPSKHRDLGLEDTRYNSVLAAFRDIVGDDKITADLITTFEPNVFCDIKGGGTRVVEDNTKRGHFRCLFDRMENDKGRVPTAQEDADFKAGKMNLWNASYEIYFQVRLVGIPEGELAKILGVNNW